MCGMAIFNAFLRTVGQEFSNSFIFVPRSPVPRLSSPKSIPPVNYTQNPNVGCVSMIARIRSTPRTNPTWIEQAVTSYGVIYFYFIDANQG